MKRIEIGQERNIPYCRAFKEDIQLVVNLMTVDTDPPILASENFEFDDADELFAFLGDNGKGEIRITRARAPALIVATIGDSVRVSTHDNSDSSIALLHRVSEVLNRCRERSPFLSTRWFVAIAALVTGACADLAMYYSKGPTGLLFVLLAIVALTGLWSLPLGKHAKTTRFYGIPRDSRRSFWQRKRDDILVGAISSVLGGALGVAATLLTQALARKS